MHDRVIASIFCAHIDGLLYIVLATSTLIFRYGQGRSRAYLAIIYQGVVTVIRPVEPFATAIKITSRDQDVNL